MCACFLFICPWAYRPLAQVCACFPGGTCTRWPAAWRSQGRCAGLWLGPWGWPGSWSTSPYGRGWSGLERCVLFLLFLGFMKPQVKYPTPLKKRRIDPWGTLLKERRIDPWYTTEREKDWPLKLHKRKLHKLERKWYSIKLQVFYLPWKHSLVKIYKCIIRLH